MKTFAQFIKEAIETLASTEAKNRGLRGDGHGDWYDTQGNLVAKTIGGKLKYFGQGGETNQQQTQDKSQPKQQAPVEKNQQQGAQQQQEQNGVAIVIGRFNPPSRNHGALLKAGFSQAKRRGYEYRIYPSRIQDGASNPLNPSLKVAYMQSMFPEYADYIIDSDNSKTIFDILASLYGDGYTDVVITTGQDRLGEFQSLVHKGEGQQYQFNSIEVVPSGVKDPDSDIESPGSSAMMRTAAATGNFERFQTGLAANMDTVEKHEMFNTVARSMKVNEDTELWRVAPELDTQGMRWSYKNDGLFGIGSLVENLNSGLVGKILRRGSNHLICVTEDGIMFKSWLKDIREVCEVGIDETTEPKKNINMNRKKISKVK